MVIKATLNTKHNTFLKIIYNILNNNIFKVVDFSKYSHLCHLAIKLLRKLKSSDFAKLVKLRKTLNWLGYRLTLLQNTLSTLVIYDILHQF